MLAGGGPKVRAPGGEQGLGGAGLSGVLLFPGPVAESRIVELIHSDFLISGRNGL